MTPISGPWRGDIANMGSHNTRYIGNVAVTDAATSPNNTAIANVSFAGDPSNRNVYWHDNTTFNGTSGFASVYSNNGNSRPHADLGNHLGVSPGLTLREVREMGRTSPAGPTTRAMRPPKCRPGDG